MTSQFGRTEVNETQGYAISRCKLFTILLVTPTQINYHGDYHSIVCYHLSPTNRTSTRIEQSVVFKIIFVEPIIFFKLLLLLLNVRLVACRQWGDSPSVRVNTLLKLNILCCDTGLVYKLTGLPKKCKCFSEISR